jgi:hypothetical protein
MWTGQSRRGRSQGVKWEEENEGRPNQRGRSSRGESEGAESEG